MSKKQNIILNKGETFSKTVLWLNPDRSKKDLAGYSGRMQIRDKFNNELILELTVENGGITVDIQNSAIKLYIDAATTAAIDKSITLGTYDLEMTLNHPSGEYVRRILEGKIYFSNEVTR